MNLPNFLVLGAAKAGTTALFHYLQQHPDIFMYPGKESNFFALMNQPLDFRGPGDQFAINHFSITSLERYLAQFDGVGHERAIGEASPLYLYDPRAPHTIQHFIPHAKLIAILRHPVERGYSAFAHMIRDGREPHPDFAHALAMEDERIADRWEHIWHYTQMGFYAAQLRRYYDLFPSHQIQVYLYDDFVHNPLAVIHDIFRFLEVDARFVPDTSMRHNVASSSHFPKPPLLPQVRQQLIQRFTPDILQLQTLLERDMSPWLEQEAPMQYMGA